ncbi:glycosyltransferase [Vibrio splendidus]
MKILFYCCEFAPEGRTGAIRPSKLAKYFDASGHDVYIIKKKPENESYRDLEDPIMHLDRTSVKLRKFFPINDDGFWFSFLSVFELYRKVRKVKPDFIFISIPVFLPLITTYIISKLTNTKYVVDYRDLWFGDPYEAKSLKDKVLRSIGSIVEPRIMKNASLVNFISEEMKNDQEKLFGSIKNSCVISTGFDDSDLKRGGRNLDSIFNGSFRYYAHIGMLDWDMNVLELINLVNKFKERLSENVKIVFVGGKNNLIIDAFKKYGLSQVCLFVDTVDKVTAIEIAKKSNGLIVLGSDSPQRLNRKIFESIACNSNIFYFGNKDSPTARVLKECNHNLILDKTVPIEVIESKFIHFIESSNERGALPKPLFKYKKSFLAKRYLTELERLL